MEAERPRAVRWEEPIEKQPPKHEPGAKSRVEEAAPLRLQRPQRSRRPEPPSPSPAPGKGDERGSRSRPSPVKLGAGSGPPRSREGDAPGRPPSARGWEGWARSGPGWGNWGKGDSRCLRYLNLFPPPPPHCLSLALSTPRNLLRAAPSLPSRPICTEPHYGHAAPPFISGRASHSLSRLSVSWATGHCWAGLLPVNTRPCWAPPLVPPLPFPDTSRER